LNFSRQAVVALILAATALFVVGILLEKGSEDDERAGSIAYATESPSEEAGGSESEESGEEGHDESDEKVLGIDLESTPFLILAVIGSLLLAGIVWFGRSPWLLLLVSASMLAFAAFDIAEVIRKLDRDEGGIAAIAGLVAVLHLAASLGSAQLRGDGSAA
jgi:hypothetical protein